MSIPENATELGRRLRQIRERIKASGQPLLDWNRIDREVRERRGEADIMYDLIQERQ